MMKAKSSCKTLYNYAAANNRGVRETTGEYVVCLNSDAQVEPAFLTELVRRLTRQGYRVAETPIVFRDRTRGKSKMSTRIIIESMLLVTRWAVVDAVGKRRRPA